MNSIQFSQAVLEWFDEYGRKDLPWQINKSPYRVWVSEIMLQQTQVKTVIGYYQRFMSSFPTLEALATAHEDQVLEHWAGLGYYARARNLHKTAKIIFDDYNGDFPISQESIEALPGIGRSTAGAILSLSLNQQAAILDGNVKRVLARFHAIEGWTGHSSVAKELWYWAESYTPKQRFDSYTQAMMDLGATLCTRSKPNCLQCPLKISCKAYKEGSTKQLPTPKPKKTLPTKHRWLLNIKNNEGEIYIEKRPPNGIWGSLWSLPETTFDLPEESITHYCRDKLLLDCEVIERGAIIKHTFSHYHLMLHPLTLRYITDIPTIKEAEEANWFKADAHQTLGMAAPIRQYMNTFK